MLQKTIPFDKPKTIPFNVTQTPNVSAVSTTTTQPNYAQRVYGQYEKAGQDIIGGIQQGAEQIQGGNLLGGLRAGLRTVGGVAGSAFAPILEAPIIKPTAEYLVKKALENKNVNEIVTKATELAKQYPNAAKDIQNLIDIATLGVGFKAQGPLAKEASLIGKDITAGTKALLTPSEEMVQNKVISLFNKSIKPTAKKTLVQGTKYENDVLKALKTIKTNADSLNIEDFSGELISGRTPQTIHELAQGVDQTKKIVFGQYDTLAKKAGTIGATIDTKPISDEVLKVAQNRALQLTNPEVVKYAEDWGTRLQGLGTLDTETTQEVVKLMNNNLQAFYRNPTYDAASKVAVDAGIANNFRQALDKAIEGATGEQYQILKNQYAALKSIENDVVRASIKDAKKNVKGLLDYTDIFTGGQMVGGILSLNPAMFTKGAIERGFKEYIKFLNNPNRAISNIFDKLNIERTPFAPKSATGQFLQKPKLGASIESIGGNQPKAVIKTPQKVLQSSPKSTPESTLKSSISKAKASGQSFDEWVKGQKPIYHGTTKTFEKFDPELSPGGSAWFTDSRKALETGQDVGLNRARGETVKIMDRYIKPGLKLVDRGTPEGKKLADDLMTGQLESQGYRGIIHEADAKRGRYVELFYPNKDALTRSQLKAEWDKIK